MTERPQQDTPAEGEAVAAQEQPKRKRRWLWLLLGLLSVVLAINLVVTVSYLITKRPLTALPGVRALTFTTPPRFLFSIYDVSRPIGVAVSPDGQRIYVTESDGERQTRIFDPNGRPLGFLSPPDSNANSRYPFYITTDAGGRVFVSDLLTRTVQIYSPAGEYAGTVPAPDGSGWAPLGLAVDRLGQLYVTDTDPKHRVLVYDKELRFEFEFGKEGAGPGEFSFANGLAIDEQGRIFLADSNNSRVDVFGPDGKHLIDFGKQGSISGGGLPHGLAIDDQQRLHVVDTVNHVVSVFNIGSPKQELLFTFGTYGIGDGQFRYPNGIAIDRGRVYVTDRVNDRVQVWAY